jgi:PTS system nitrogen regulatory IIA component
MDLSDLIRPNAVLPSVKATSKRQVIQELAAKGAELTGLDERQVFETLMEREKLGSTGIGEGIAIPHGKVAGLDGIHGAFARLSKPIDFEALDDEPVDLVFLLLAPEGAGADHLKALARIARILRVPGVAERLRNTSDATALYRILSESAAPSAA